jgi:hypothetical protein
MLRALPVLAPVLAAALLAGCAHRPRGAPFSLRPYDFSYRVRWHGRKRSPHVAVFSNAEGTYFLLPNAARRHARIFARVGQRLRPVPFRTSSPYLVAACLARRWLVTDGDVGYGTARARRVPRGRPCLERGSEPFIGRLVRPRVRREGTRPSPRRQRAESPPRTRVPGRIARAFRRALARVRRCRGCVRGRVARPRRPAVLRLFGRKPCLPTAVFGRGSIVSLRLNDGCRLRAAYAVHRHRLYALDPRRLGRREIRLVGARPPLLLDFNRGLVALVARGSVRRRSLTRRALVRLVRRGRRGRRKATVWPLRHDLRRTLRAWCRQAGCRLRGRIPRFRLSSGRFRGSFPTVLRALLHRLSHEGLVLRLRLDRSHRTLRVRTLWFHPRP